MNSIERELQGILDSELERKLISDSLSKKHKQLKRKLFVKRTCKKINCYFGLN